MKKILLVEVDRINQLMGNKQLLNEQWVGALVKSLTGFVDDAAKKGWNIGKTIEPELEALAKVTNDEEAVKILATISNKSKEFADKILPEVMNSLSKNVKDEIENILNLAKKEMDSGKSMSVVDDVIDKKVDNTFGTEFKGVKDLIKQQIKDDISKYKPNINPIISTADETLKKKFEKIFNQWETIAPGSLKLKDRILLTDSLWYRGLRARLNQRLNIMFKTEDESLKRIAELVKESMNAANNAESKKIIFKNIDLEIENLRNSPDFNKDIVYEILQDELSKKITRSDASELVRKLKENQPLENYPTWLADFIDQSYLVKMFKRPRTKDGKLKVGEMMANFFERTAMTLLTGNPRKFQEIMDEFVNAYGRSALKGLGYYYLWMQFVHRTFWPAVLSFGDWFIYITKNKEGKEGKFIDVYKQLFYERFKDTFIAYNKKFEESAGMNKYEINMWKSFLKTINPFEFLWDDLVHFLDWNTEGGAIRAWNRWNEHNLELIKNNEALKKMRDEYDNTLKKSDSLIKNVDSLEEKIKNLGQEKISGQMIDKFYEFIKQLPEYGGKIGTADKDYMKQDPTNKLQFTFEEESGNKRIFIYDPAKDQFIEK